MTDIVNRLREVAGIETGLLYSRRNMLNEAADAINSLLDELSMTEAVKGVVTYAGADAVTKLLETEAERDASKALCDEMAKALERIAALTPAQANAVTSRDLHLHVKAIANNALAAYRKDKEVGNG